MLSQVGGMLSQVGEMLSQVGGMLSQVGGMRAAAPSHWHACCMYTYIHVESVCPCK